MFKNVLKIIAIILLSIALFKNPYSYYISMRWLLSISFGILIYFYSVDKNYIFQGLFVVLLVIYNPLLPIHSTREIWTIINIVTIALIAVSFFDNKLYLNRG